MSRQKRREFKRELPCKLTTEERDAKATMLSNAIHNLDELKDEKKRANADFNLRIKDGEAYIRDVREHYASGLEPRTVKCAEYITNHGTIEVIREDTGEVVETRRAVESELQMDLPGTKTAAARKTAAKAKKVAAKAATKKTTKPTPKKAPKKPKVPPKAK